MSGEGGGQTSLISGGAAAASGTGNDVQSGNQTQQQAAPAFKFPDNFDYKSIVPEDIRGDAVFAKYRDLDGVFRGLHGAQKLIGKDPSSLVEIPASTDAAATRALMNRLGASEKVEDYKIEPVKGAPEWLGGDQPLGKWLAKTAHENGVPIGVMNKLYSGFVGEMMRSAGDQQKLAVETAARSIQALKDELGDNFEGTVRRANLAVSKLGGAPLREALEAADLGVHPVVIKALAQVGALYAESDDGGDDKGQGADSLPSEDKQRAHELTAQSLNTSDPVEKKRLQAEARKYFEKASKGRKV